jgi:hypothetical protein
MTEVSIMGNLYWVTNKRTHNAIPVEVDLGEEQLWAIECCWELYKQMLEPKTESDFVERMMLVDDNLRFTIIDRTGPELELE